MTTVAIAACWLGIAVVGCKIVTSCIKWANTNQPVTGTREPYRNFEPDIPAWTNGDECPDAVAVYNGVLCEVWL